MPYILHGVSHPLKRSSARGLMGHPIDDIWDMYPVERLCTTPGLVLMGHPGQYWTHAQRTNPHINDYKLTK